ncbi:MAG: ABC transporter ATP-binding protein, partial [Acidobacteria bacterium]|nr:ABC transporter ATP-binding protein [Acidobacteriota bacterium]
MSINLQQVFKNYHGHAVVHDLSLEVSDGEFFVLLGPSGSGKSTVLRMIAGLVELDAGRILLRGVDVTERPPQKRGVGFVFQSYALFRHMTVADNVEFALRIRRIGTAARRRRRMELLELVGLTGLEKRYPHQLSGGQQQRVALARALAHEPQVLLLDEPFGALDAKIRTELRRSVKRIQRELGVTTIFVTHDQEEAFELADRLGVMNYGHLLETGPPHELYLRPQTEFVATFLGRANLMVGDCHRRGVRIGPIEIPFEGGVHADTEERRVQVLFRPEDVAVKQTADALRWPSLGEATVEDSEFSGSIERLRLRLPQLAGVRTIAPQAPYGADYAVVDAIRSQNQARNYPLRPGGSRRRGNQACTRVAPSGHALRRGGPRGERRGRPRHCRPPLSTRARTRGGTPGRRDDHCRPSTRESARCGQRRNRRRSRTARARARPHSRSTVRSADPHEALPRCRGDARVARRRGSAPRPSRR